MINFSLILLLAGSSQRSKLGYNKILYQVNNKPLFWYSLKPFLEIENCCEIVLVCKREEIEEIKKYLPNKRNIKIVEGGKTRQESVLLGLEASQSPYVLVHDGARPHVNINDIQKVVDELNSYDSVTLATPVKECLRVVNNSKNEVVRREDFYTIKTPQGLKKSLLLEGLKKAQNDNIDFYDDVSVLERFYQIAPKIIIGREDNIKVTTSSDLEVIEKLLGENMDMRIGHSYDIHQLEKGLKIIIGGVAIPSELGIKAHSDGDVLYHAISEAIIGALGKGDLGTHFSDKDEKYKNISSSYFLKETKKMLEEEHYQIQNIDATIFIESPMMAPYIPLMKKNICSLLNIGENQINIKATRGEKVGPIGLQEAVASEAVIIIKK